MKPIVSIIMGSTSDLPVMEKAAKFFDEMEIPFEINALSAHRTPDAVEAFAKGAKERGIKVITTTLASSRWKSLDQINEAGRWACYNLDGTIDLDAGENIPGTSTILPQNEVIWWEQNWRKGGLQERRLQIIKEYDFYNQLYCGCEFSMRKDA